MSDSEVQVPDGWGTATIGEFVTDYRGGASLSPKDFSDQGFPIIPKKGIQKGGLLIEERGLFCHNEFAQNNKTKIVNNSYLITTLRDLVPTGPSIGLIVKYIDDKEYILAQGVYGFRLNEKLYKDYLVQVSNTDFYRSQMRKIFVGSTQVHIRTPEFFNVSIATPPFPEQKKIASILTSVDDVIEKTEAQISKLQDLKKGMMTELLTKGIGHTEFKDSPVGRIPVSWEMVTFKDVSIKIQDGTHFSPKSKEGNFKYVTSKNIRFGYLDTKNVQMISKKEHNEIYRRCDVRYGDILFTKDGASTGNAAINTFKEPISLLSSVAFIRCDPTICLNSYIFQFILSDWCQKEIQDLMTGNAITRLTLEKIKGMIIPLPSVEEQANIVQSVTSIDSTIFSKQQKLSHTKSLKKALMNDLLTGKVRVSTTN